MKSTRTRKATWSPWVLLVVLPALLPAAGDEDDAAAKARYAASEAAVRALWNEHRQAYSNDAGMLTGLGLLADRRAGRVTLWARAMSLGPYDPVEFFVIGPRSGHDYEAAAVAFAEPLAVHEALEFVGMRAGKGIDRQAARFWPKGERVRVWFEWEESSTNGPALEKRIPAERLVVDRGSGETLPVMGFVFAGSRMVPDPEDTNRQAYAAQVYGPMSIASSYNEPGTVLDVPRQAIQEEVYDRQFANPEHRFLDGQLVRVVLEPERRAPPPRVLDLDLELLPPVDGGGGAAGFRLSAPGSGGVWVTNGGPAQLLAAFERAVSLDRDPYVTVRPAAALPLRELRDCCSLLASIESPKGIRIEPPREDDLYYRAFLPDERFRDRAKRFAMPCELRLAAGDGQTGTVTAVLVDLEERWVDERDDYELSITETPVSSPEAVRALLAERPSPPLLYVFAPQAMPYGALVEWALASRATHPTVYVYLEPPPGR